MSSNSIIFLAVVAMTLGVGLVTTADSFAQENATTAASNQTTAMGNTTEMSNQTDAGGAGQISFFGRDV